MTSRMATWTCLDGIYLSGDVFNETGFPSIIFAHGGGQTRRAWRITAGHLAQAGFRITTFDMRGHGQSDWSDTGAYDEADLVRDIATIAAADPDPRPILAGASIGGMAALAAIGLGEVDARALVLVDMAARTERAGFDRIKSFMEAGREGFATVEDAAAELSRYRGTPPPKDPSGLAKALRVSPDGRLRWHWDPAFLDARQRDFDTREVRLSTYARGFPAPRS